MNKFKGIIDTTLREGQQSPILFNTQKYSFSTNDKLKIVDKLLQLNVKYIELFAPVISNREREDFIRMKKYVNSNAKRKVIFLAHCRCNDEDIKQSLSLGFDGLNLYIGKAAYKSNNSSKENEKNLVERAVSTIRALRETYPRLYIRFSLEDSFRTSLNKLFAMYDKIYELVNTFGLPDSVGIANPDMVTKRIRILKNRYPNVNLECHFHNDQGLALANSIAAITAGAQFINTSIWGLGERSGITSLTGLLLNLYSTNKTYCKDYDLKQSYSVNKVMEEILNTQMPYSEPVSQINRTHVAGVHQKAIQYNSKIYEAHNLKKFGVTESKCLIGPLSGWNSIYYIVKQIKGCNITIEQAKEISKIFKENSDKLDKQYSPDKLLNKIIQKYRRK